ncbi:MAG TPA: nitrate/sulfonate/bicarbonate ABC transporter ATP-binding protein [Bryobacteraceae bacterium]|jgi:NitT/TauT family transport system ATP-binding protein|nr:nitrate/sulfonate/bicarbonate ABC transporter ATP-binding protein [Bryobacteraceae bacterium]
MRESIIEARALEKFYGEPGSNPIQVIAPTDLSVYAGEILAVLGPSGSGKSTLLRMLTGLSAPSAGEVLWHGKPVTGQSPNVSIVFQSFALFPWLTVLENVEAPLKARGLGEIPRRKRSLKILETVGLDGFEAAYPKELSGGMKQRVGFARALVVEPEVLFMDEPFSALDVLTAENLRTETLELWANKSLPTRAIYLVTHNIEEAVLLADRVIVLGKNPGRIRTDFQVGLPQPRDRKSAGFLQLVDHIYKVLTQPDASPQFVPEAEAAPLPPGAPRAKYPMLPHARPGGISGMLEILSDRSGHDDIYHLADDLSFEIDDVLPIVEAASMLGFVHVSEGDVELTPAGREYVEADIGPRKELFAHAAMKRVLLIRQIKRALESKSNHMLPDEFFHDTLDEHFSEQETIQQLDTAINWGRYAGLFDYDSASRKFYIADEEPETVPA